MEKGGCLDTRSLQVPFNEVFKLGLACISSVGNLTLLQLGVLRSRTEDHHLATGWERREREKREESKKGRIRIIFTQHIN